MSISRALALVLLTSGCAPKAIVREGPPSIDDLAAVVRAEDRTAEDRALDGGRKPVGLLQFTGVHRGARVAEIGAGRGYTTDLLARVVGGKGVVFAQNPAKLRELIGAQVLDPIYARLAGRGVVQVLREFDDPLPPEATNLDLVVMNLIYHDTVWLGTDRAKMNKAIFAALRPGGHYVIADSSAIDGSGTDACRSLHRIDRALVREEVLRAGFVLETESPLYRNPEDKRDWNSSPQAAGERRGTSDRFLLKFLKRAKK